MDGAKSEILQDAFRNFGTARKSRRKSIHPKDSEIMMEETYY